MNRKIIQTGVIGTFPIGNPEKIDGFYVDWRSAVVFDDISKQPVLDIPEGSIVKNVLSVGWHKWDGKDFPIATIQEPEGAICYILPDWYYDWCHTCVILSIQGKNLFPSEVEFSRTNGRYAADFLL